MTERLVTAGIPSEQTAQGQGRQARQQEVGDPVQMQGTEGHHGDGQRERETGRQREEFTGRDEEGGHQENGRGRPPGEAGVLLRRSHLFLSVKVLQLISSTYAIIKGTM